MSLQFVQLPLALLKDGRLTPTDIRIAGLILEHLRGQVPGWVCNKSLARDASINIRSVPKSLRRLEAAGWFRCEPSEKERNKRRIVRLWQLRGEPSSNDAIDHAPTGMVTMPSGAPSTMPLRASKVQRRKYREEVQPPAVVVKRSAAAAQSRSTPDQDPKTTATRAMKAVGKLTGKRVTQQDLEAAVEGLASALPAIQDRGLLRDACLKVRDGTVPVETVRQAIKDAREHGSNDGGPWDGRTWFAVTIENPGEEIIPW